MIKDVKSCPDKKDSYNVSKKVTQRYCPESLLNLYVG